MGKEDDKLVAEELFRMNGQINDMLILGTATKTSVAVLNVTVEGHGKKIDNLDGKVDKLTDVVTHQPEGWRRDIKEAVKGCQEQRDEVTQAVRKAKAESLPSARHSGSNWFVTFWKDSARPLATFLVLAGLAIGAGIAVKYCGGPYGPKDYMDQKVAPAKAGD
ncbi:MAG: hypothetical protein ACYTBJ_00140 [Planctomycetota bacterium]|jgi:hypothetical protein